MADGGVKRVETGPIKIDNDWTGYFFRGDELPSTFLRYIAKRLENPEAEGGEIPIKDIIDWLNDLADEMDTCIENRHSR